jgi:hypothetical protein
MSGFTDVAEVLLSMRDAFTHDPKIDVSMKEYFTLIEELYGDNGVISICFYLATLSVTSS